MDKAPDAFRTISEVAEELNVPQHVLRFWESRFREIKPLKRGGGRRYYRPEDIGLLRGIHHLLYGEGYTIRGVQRILRDQGTRFVQTVWQPGAPRPATTCRGRRPFGYGRRGCFHRGRSAARWAAPVAFDHRPRGRQVGTERAIDHAHSYAAEYPVGTGGFFARSCARSGAEADGGAARSRRVPEVARRFGRLVSRFRSSHHSAAPTFANFGIEGH